MWVSFRQCIFCKVCAKGGQSPFSPSPIYRGLVANMSTIKKPNNVVLGNKTMPISQVLPLTDSTDLYQEGKQAELLERLKKDGYIYVRGVIKHDTARTGREKILSFIEKKGAIMPGTDLMEAKIAHQAGVGAKKRKGQYQEGFCISTRTGGCTSDREPECTQDAWMEFAQTDPIYNMYAGPEVLSFFDSVFGKHHHKNFPDCTWLRMKGRGEVTAEHADYYYFKGNTEIFSENMGKEASPAQEICKVCNKNDRPEETLICDICGHGCHMDCARPKMNEVPEGEWHCHDCADLPFNFYTCWVSWGNARLGLEGGLCLQPGTHSLLRGFDDPLPGKPLLPQGYRKEKSHLKWHSADFGEGDIVLFNIKTVHCASKNYSYSYRLSCDTRVFYASDSSTLHKDFINRPGHEVRCGPAGGHKRKGGAEGSRPCKRQATGGMMM
eukprot:g79759.t1